MKKVFIEITNEVSVADAVLHLEGLGYEQVWPKDFTPEGMATTITGDSEGEIGWCKDRSWASDHGYERIELPTTKHKHYDLIVKWAADPSQKVWYYNGSGWFLSVIEPVWNPDYTYHIGDTPPKKQIKIGGVWIDEPVREPLSQRQEYYTTIITYDNLFMKSRWDGGNVDLVRLKRGLVHLTKEAAIAHAKALIALTGECE